MCTSAHFSVSSRALGGKVLTSAGCRVITTGSTDQLRAEPCLQMISPRSCHKQACCAICRRQMQQGSGTTAAYQDLHHSLPAPLLHSNRYCYCHLAGWVPLPLIHFTNCCSKTAQQSFISAPGFPAALPAVDKPRTFEQKPCQTHQGTATLLSVLARNFMPGCWILRVTSSRDS
jgi:hypothetical protein